MQNNPSNGTRRRPVDALFGDAGGSSSNYVVEPPQPATAIFEPVAEPMTLASEPPPPVLSTVDSEATSTRADDPRFLTLSFQIERLYDDVKTQLRDSVTISNQCFDLLLQARQAHERRDYARAEFLIQSTDAKIKRSVQSQATSAPILLLLWLWQAIALLIGGGIIAISYVTGLTLFGLPVASELIVLLRALAWGMIGGVIGTATHLPRLIQRREYDPAYNMNYFARPFVGLLIGALLFLLSQAGILAGTIIIGDFNVGPIFLYLFALIAGYKQEYVNEFFDNLMKAIFRAPPSSG